MPEGGLGRRPVAGSGLRSPRAIGGATGVCAGRRGDREAAHARCSAFCRSPATRSAASRAAAISGAYVVGRSARPVSSIDQDRRRGGGEPLAVDGLAVLVEPERPDPQRPQPRRAGRAGRRIPPAAGSCPTPVSCSRSASRSRQMARSQPGVPGVRRCPVLRRCRRSGTGHGLGDAARATPR